MKAMGRKGCNEIIKGILFVGPDYRIQTSF